MMWPKYIVTLALQLMLLLVFWLEFARRFDMLFFYLELLGPVLMLIFCIYDLQFVSRRKFSAWGVTGFLLGSGAVIALYYWLLLMDSVARS